MVHGKPTSANIREEDGSHFYISFSLHGANFMKEGLRHDFNPPDALWRISSTQKTGLSENYIENGEALTRSIHIHKETLRNGHPTHIQHH